MKLQNQDWQNLHSVTTWTTLSCLVTTEYSVPFCSCMKPVLFRKRLPNRCRTGLVYPFSSSGKHRVSDSEVSTLFTTQSHGLNVSVSLGSSGKRQSWKIQLCSQPQSSSSSLQVQRALPAHYCQYQRERKFSSRCCETVRGWEAGLSVLTMIFSLHRATMRWYFLDTFTPHTNPAWQKQWLKHWPRIPRYPAARLGVAIAGLLAIPDFSHTQGSAL